MLPVRRTDNPFELLQHEIDRAFDRVWGMGGDGGSNLAYAATASYPVDIREDENSIIVDAELPGFTKDQINVTMEQGVLTITAVRKEAEGAEAAKGERHLRERRFARVSRSFRLPIPVDENKVDAKLEHGVLTLTLPKREEVKPRRIEVK